MFKCLKLFFLDIQNLTIFELKILKSTPASEVLYSGFRGAYM